MVTAVTTMGRNGLADFVIQRVSAIVLGAYTVFLVAYLAAHPDLQYTQWQELFGQLWMRIFSLMALISVAAHAWIGLWSVVTDYLTERLLGPKALVLRLLALGIYALVTVCYLVWGVEILWGF
jgi:succinate dehydrogenase / fumarate reductase membrane anchor subunit